MFFTEDEAPDMGSQEMLVKCGSKAPSQPSNHSGAVLASARSELPRSICARGSLSSWLWAPSSHNALGTRVKPEHQEPSEPQEWLRGLPSFSSGCWRSVPPSLSPPWRVPREPASRSAEGCSVYSNCHMQIRPIEEMHVYTFPLAECV